MSTPYRPSTSVHPTTAPSIAVMLAFAKFANSKYTEFKFLLCSEISGRFYSIKKIKFI